jgi:predicted CXXCH cytochrome family protein
LSTDATVWSPGGDFFWLTQSYTNSNWSGSVTSDPDNMGHNVISADYGLTLDATNSSAPGGGYPSSKLSCASCHDPHGQVSGGTANGSKAISVSGSYGGVPANPLESIAGNYRLLGDTQYGVIGAPAPIAVTSGYGETDAKHVAYGTGMSDWCASCHGDYLVSTKTEKHPTGINMGGVLAGNYRAYVATGDMGGGAGDNSYTALVPFERNTADKSLLDPTDTSGPASNSQVMCLTCHRAHASAFTNITRWDMEHELLAESWPNAGNLTAMGAIADSAYYGRDIETDFGEFQRSLCNKCHVKD